MVQIFCIEVATTQRHFNGHAVSINLLSWANFQSEQFSKVSLVKIRNVEAASLSLISALTISNSNGMTRIATRRTCISTP